MLKLLPSVRYQFESRIQIVEFVIFFTRIIKYWYFQRFSNILHIKASNLNLSLKRIISLHLSVYE